MAQFNGEEWLLHVARGSVHELRPFIKKILPKCRAHIHHFCSCLCCRLHFCFCGADWNAYALRLFRSDSEPERLFILHKQVKSRKTRGKDESGSLVVEPDHSTAGKIQMFRSENILSQGQSCSPSAEHSGAILVLRNRGAVSSWQPSFSIWSKNVGNSWHRMLSPKKRMWKDMQNRIIHLALRTSRR